MDELAAFYSLNRRVMITCKVKVEKPEPSESESEMGV